MESQEQILLSLLAKDNYISVDDSAAVNSGASLSIEQNAEVKFGPDFVEIEPIKIKDEEIDVKEDPTEVMEESLLVQNGPVCSTSPAAQIHQHPSQSTFLTQLEQNVAVATDVLLLENTSPKFLKDVSTSDNKDDIFNSASLDDASQAEVSITEVSGCYGALKKKKLTRVNLSIEDETRVAKWLRENPMLYDRNRKDFKDTGRKWAMYNDLAKTLKPPLTGKLLRTWVDGMRSRYGRLTNLGTGSAAPKMSKREQWVFDTFSFFATHITRTKMKSSHTSQMMWSQTKQSQMTECHTSQSQMMQYEASDFPEEDNSIYRLDEGRPSSATSTVSHLAKRPRSTEVDMDDMRQIMECMAKVASVAERFNAGTGPDPDRHSAQVAKFCNFMYHTLVNLRPDICNAAMRTCALEIFKAQDQQLNLPQRSETIQQQLEP